MCSSDLEDIDKEENKKACHAGEHRGQYAAWSKKGAAHTDACDMGYQYIKFYKKQCRG